MERVIMKKKPSAYDLATRTDEAIAELKSSGVDMSKVYVWLPDGHGWMKQYGPMPAEEAARKCKEYYGTK